MPIDFGNRNLTSGDQGLWNKVTSNKIYEGVTQQTPKNTESKDDKVFPFIKKQTTSSEVRTQFTTESTVKNLLLARSNAEFFLKIPLTNKKIKLFGKVAISTTTESMYPKYKSAKEPQAQYRAQTGPTTTPQQRAQTKSTVPPQRQQQTRPQSGARQQSTPNAQYQQRTRPQSTPRPQSQQQAQGTPNTQYQQRARPQSAPRPQSQQRAQGTPNTQYQQRARPQSAPRPQPQQRSQKAGGAQGARTNQPPRQLSPKQEFLGKIGFSDGSNVNYNALVQKFRTVTSDRDVRKLSFLFHPDSYERNKESLNKEFNITSLEDAKIAFQWMKSYHTPHTEEDDMALKTNYRAETDKFFPPPKQA